MDVTKIFAERGDLAHLALFLWATGASSLLVFTLRELVAQTRRFDAFVAEIAHLNRRLNAEADASATLPK
ncbi:hypothetical protein [Oryzibacter oryziterrae]|uniref:hypothetical protein n=1 Tax=Oryzibacter oryziterrae TaxID=2766474 RepID=UPI001F4716D4|nr:hypothetical protein [Oryzibacter oryziterrae]